MAIRPMDIIDVNRNVVAQLHWAPPGVVTVVSENAALKAFLEDLVQRYSSSGIPSMTGGSKVVNGQKSTNRVQHSLPLIHLCFFQELLNCWVLGSVFPDRKSMGSFGGGKTCGVPGTG